MTIPVLSALLSKYPSTRVTVLTKKGFAPLFENLENVHVHVAEVKKQHKGLTGLWRLFKELQKLDFDVVVDLHNVLRSNVLKKYFALGRVPFYQIDKGRKEKKSLIKGKKGDFKPLKSTHQRYADVFAKLGFSLDLEQARFLERQTLSEKVLDLVGQDSRKWVGVAPFAAHEGKMYPLSLMESVLDKLVSTDRYKILLFGGGSSEIAKLDTIARSRKHVINIAGSLSFSEELALISNLDIMVSMDSGNAHMAANYNIPVITLWGVTHPNTGFYPFNQPIENALLSDRERYPLIPTSVYGNKVPPGYEKVMETILPETVFSKIEEVLNG